MMMQLLAQAAGSQPVNDSFSTATLLAILGGLGTLIGAIGTVIHGKNQRAAGKAEVTQIGPQPFMVELKETFVTRREHDRLEALVAVNATRVEGMFRETMTEVKNLNATTNKTLIRQGERLSQEIKDVATGAYLGRQKIHTSVNANAERLSKVEERADVASEIGKMSEAIVEAIETIKVKN